MYILVPLSLEMASVSLLTTIKDTTVDLGY